MSTEITINQDIVEINVTEEVITIEAPSGAYPLPSLVNSVFGRVGNVVAQEGDYTLTQIGDVTLTSPSNGQVLKYNGTAWVNSSDTDTGLTSVGLSMPSAFSVANSPLTANGTLSVTGAGTTAQYVRGDGTLATFPSLTGYVPYTGATQAVNLGAFDLTVQGLTIGKGNSSLSNNSALGYRALFHITTGNYNTAVGYESSHNTTTGQYNTSLGQSALFTNTTGSQNTALGLNALLLNTSGSSNVVVGLDGMQHNTTGGSNTALGYNAGSHITGGTTPNTTASNSVFIGRDTRANVDGGTNEIVIGSAVTGNGSNTVTIGSSSITANYFKGSINADSFVKSGGTASQYLMANGSVSTLTNPVTGTGTTNTLPKFTGASTIGNSNVSDSGTLITLGSNTNISSGSLGIGNTNLSTISLRVSKNITGGIGANAIQLDGTIQSDVTSIAFYNSTSASTQAAAFTLNQLFHYAAIQGTFGAGSSVTTQTGFRVDATLIGATTNYGFRGSIPSGTNRWNLYMDGTANNYLAGSLGIGATILTGTNLLLGKTITGATESNGVVQQGLVLSDVTATANGFYNILTTQAASFTLVNYIHFRTTQAAIGAGSSISNQVGFQASGALVGATNNYGFRGQIPVGTGRWNIYMDGMAANYLAGDTGIGTTTLGTATQLTIGGTETAVSAIGRGQLINTTLVASANNDSLFGLDINPTYTTGAFTGVFTADLRLNNRLYFNSPNWTLGDNLTSINHNAGLRINSTSAGSHILFRGVGFNTYMQMFNNTGNFILQNGGTFTDAGFRLDVNGTTRLQGSTTITGSTTAASAIARGVNITSTLVAAANNDVLVGLDISPTFTNGAFTGVTNIPLRISNSDSGRGITFVSQNFSINSLGASISLNGGVGYNFDILPSASTTPFRFRNSGIVYLQITSTANVLIGTTTDIASSKLTVNSTTQGFLPPRMTTTEKNAIASPATGLVVFDTTLGKLCVFAGTWQTITSV
jgi:hypothetical protein